MLLIIIGDLDTFLWILIQVGGVISVRKTNVVNTVLPFLL